MLQNIDHIVYAVNDLGSAVKSFQVKSGLKVTSGGQHIQYGTHNALIRIGQRTYLEFIAIDKTLPKPKNGTWMGLDFLKEEKITRWALSSSQITKDAKVLNQYNNKLGLLKNGSRKKSDGTLLEWNMTSVLARPEVEVAPFILDWKESIHPTVGLPLECGIIDYKIFTSKLESVLKLMMELGVKCQVVESPIEKIELILGTPKGQFVL